jgi:hypothetical protein
MKKQKGWTGSLPPGGEKGIHLPEGGWEERSYYVVDVSFHYGNPIHRSIFYTGFLNGKDGGPGGYNQVMNPTYDSPVVGIDKVHHMKVLRKINMGAS